MSEYKIDVVIPFTCIIHNYSIDMLKHLSPDIISVTSASVM